MARRGRRRRSKLDRDVRAVGVDVSKTRGADVVILRGDRTVECADAGYSPAEVGDLLRRAKPQIVAIDSPPGLGIGEPSESTRRCEQHLRSQGINIFSTPSDPESFTSAFFDWVRVGEEIFEAAGRAGFPRQEAERDVWDRAIEVFPHASDVYLRGCLPPAGTSRRVTRKRAWRSQTLRDAKVPTDDLVRNRLGRPTLDSIDAALAALTGLNALEGAFTAFGRPGEWLVVPGAPPDTHFTRCSPPGDSAS